MMNISDILERAADVVESRGWCQNRSSNVVGEVCAVGAIGVVLKLLPADVVSYLQGNYRNTIEAHLLLNQVKYFCRAHLGEGLIAWNDRKGRTKEQVIDKLRYLSSLAKEEGK